MNLKVIDLRSDTLTLPTEEMLISMMTAKLGDDGRTDGLKGEDPTVIQLEELAAQMFGKEDAIFVPSGTMGNIISIMAQANRGDTIVVAQNAHIYKNEKGIFDKDIFGYIPEFVPYNKGAYCLDKLEEALKAKNISVVCLENTFNYEGGTVISSEQTKAITDLCKQYDVSVHLDGARIFNASVALKEDVKELTEGIDSVSFCLSKGLCAPIGAVIVGRSEFIKKARIIRKLIGGQMRQAGILAAAGIVALENMTNRLIDDHKMAQKLAEGLLKVNGLKIDMKTVQTNIVKVALESEELTSDQFVKVLSKKFKVKGGATSEKTLRFVTYNGIKEGDIYEAVIRINECCGEVIK